MKTGKLLPMTSPGLLGFCLLCAASTLLRADEAAETPAVKTGNDPAAQSPALPGDKPAAEGEKAADSSIKFIQPPHRLEAAQIYLLGGQSGLEISAIPAQAVILEQDMSILHCSSTPSQQGWELEIHPPLGGALQNALLPAPQQPLLNAESWKKQHWQPERFVNDYGAQRWLLAGKMYNLLENPKPLAKLDAKLYESAEAITAAPLKGKIALLVRRVIKEDQNPTPQPDPGNNPASQSPSEAILMLFADNAAQSGSYELAIIQDNPEEIDFHPQTLVWLDEQRLLAISYPLRGQASEMWAMQLDNNTNQAKAWLIDSANEWSRYVVAKDNIRRINSEGKIKQIKFEAKKKNSN